MSSHNFAKKFQRSVARNGLYIASWLFDRLPYSAIRIMTRSFLFVGFQLTRRQRRIARESLEIAFGREKDPQEIAQIVKECFYNLGKGMSELIYFLAHPKTVSQKVSFEGKQYLDEALKNGHGVIAVTAHFGNFPVMMLRFALEGYQTNAIIRPARDQELEAYLFKRRTDVGLKTIYAVPRKDCVTNCLKALRENEIVFVPLDQNFGSAGGVFVDFFGQKAATATGPIIFAKRTGAVILPCLLSGRKMTRIKLSSSRRLPSKKGPTIIRHFM